MFKHIKAVNTLFIKAVFNEHTALLRCVFIKLYGKDLHSLGLHNFIPYVQPISTMENERRSLIGRFSNAISMPSCVVPRFFHILFRIF